MRHFLKGAYQYIIIGPLTTRHSRCCASISPTPAFLKVIKRWKNRKQQLSWEETLESLTNFHLKLKNFCRKDTCGHKKVIIFLPCMKGLILSFKFLYNLANLSLRALLGANNLISNYFQMDMYGCKQLYVE